MKIRRTRAERFGAFVATDDPPALIAVDRRMAQKLGVHGGSLWEGEDPGLELRNFEGPTEAHLSVTQRCPAGCHGCYADALPTGHEPSFDALKERIDMLAQLGTFSVAFGGGEGALRSDLPALAAHARKRGMVPTLTTSGWGITARNAKRFCEFAQINVSWDGPPSVYLDVRGYDGAKRAEHAVHALRAEGIPVGINTVLTQRSFEQIEATANTIATWNIVELQLLRFKPSGRGQLTYLAMRLRDEQRIRFPHIVRELCERHS